MNPSNLHFMNVVATLALISEIALSSKDEKKKRVLKELQEI